MNALTNDEKRVMQILHQFKQIEPEKQVDKNADVQPVSPAADATSQVGESSSHFHTLHLVIGISIWNF